MAWKVIGNLLVTTEKVPAPKKSVSRGISFSFSPGSNLSPIPAMKHDRESRKKLNEFAQVLRYFQVVNLSGELI